MKTIRLNSLIAILSIAAFVSCSKDVQRNDNTAQPAEKATPAAAVDGNATTGRNTAPSGPCNSNAYIITLESRSQVNGAWEWVWSVQNSNPGNGSNGTVQDLSHWGMQFGPCVNVTSISGAAYSADGVNWTSFAPAYQADGSQACMSTPVLKFDYGTTGGAKSYYKLVFNTNYSEVSAPGYYKSGNNTGCCTFNFTGVGCTEGENPDIR
ncbi:MAG: hypothetical protein JNM88_00290 [Chitinophagaceae bacterium]|nr:hypothetical protein [Chitinophagaceae bacterium]